MKLSEQLNSLLNQQVLHEFKNSQIYYQIQSYFENMQLKNIANYFGEQAKHEEEHARMFLKHINDRTGGNVKLENIPFDGIDLNSIEDIADMYVLTEEQTTERIEEIYYIANSTRSYIDLSFILKMLNEQVEEEDSANEFALKIKMVKDIVLFDATFE